MIPLELLVIGLLLLLPGRAGVASPTLRPVPRRREVGARGLSPLRGLLAQVARRCLYANALKEAGVEKEPIGIDNLDMPALEAFQKANIKIVNGWPAISRARTVKTRDEIELLKQASSIGDAAMWKIKYEWLKPGVREREIEAKVHEFMLERGCEIIYDIIVASGGNAGIATAAAAKALGVTCEVFVPTVSSPAKQQKLREIGAQVVVTPTNVPASSVRTADSGSKGAVVEPARISTEAKPPGLSSRL